MATPLNQALTYAKTMAHPYEMTVGLSGGQVFKGPIHEPFDGGVLRIETTGFGGQLSMVFVDAKSVISASVRLVQ